MGFGESLSTGRSGLANSSSAISVVANNIANVNTTGFKGSRTEFADLISVDAGAGTGKVGLGSRIGDVRTLFTQGAIESTGRSLDIAIDGAGLFVLRDGQGRVYTRAGNMQLTKDGTITNTLGMPLQGSPVDAAGQTNGTIQDVVIQGAVSDPKATANATLKGNLQADAALMTFDMTSSATAFATSDYSTSLNVYDSVGAAHEVFAFFSKTANASAGPPAVQATWAVNFAVKGSDVGSAADLVSIGSTTLTFDGGGNAISGSPTTLTAAFNGGSQSIAVDLSGMKQFAGDSGINFVVQDGYAQGGLESLAVDGHGVLSGTFSNGQTRPLFQLAVARFPAEEGLAPGGHQLYRETLDSGAPAISTAGTNGNGTIVSAALEGSNVQIAQEFIDLITFQRSFQANARVITTSDQVLQDLINIVR